MICNVGCDKGTSTGINWWAQNNICVVSGRV